MSVLSTNEEVYDKRHGFGPRSKVLVLATITGGDTSPSTSSETGYSRPKNSPCDTMAIKTAIITAVAIVLFIGCVLRRTAPEPEWESWPAMFERGP